MRKVLLLRSTDSFLGAENVVLQLALHLPEFGYQPVIAVTQDAGQDTPELVIRANKLDIDTHVFHASGALDFSVVGRLKRYVKDNAIDLIHSHGYREDIYLLLAGMAGKTVATNHLWKRNTTKLKLYAFLDSFAMRFFPQLVAVSAPIKNEMTALKLPAKKIEVVSNGISIPSLAKLNQVQLDQRKADLGLPLDAINFVMVSSLTLEKGHTYALQALAQLTAEQRNKLCVNIIGDGPEANNLKLQAESLKLGESVRFLGRRSDVMDILPLMDCFLMPSLNEGLPMAMLEAMSVGLPLIATSVGDIPLVFAKAEQTIGVIVDSGDSSILADALVSLLDNELSLENWGENAKVLLQQHFSATAMAREYSDLYSQV